MKTMFRPVAIALLLAGCAAGPPVDELPTWEKRVAMVPMRDGVRLRTEIFVPTDAAAPLPILLERTPYGVTGDDTTTHPSLGLHYAELAKDGYIFVFQDNRGRYGSEGEFVMMRPPRTATGADIDEGTDAYDTVAWLLENVPGNNGRVGILGISYGGWLTAMAMIEPHPAVKAFSPQASPSDMFIGDDFLHNGAFRLAPSFGYVAMMERGKTITPFDFPERDAYEWYLSLGPLSNADTILGDTRTWPDYVAHHTYDEYWRAQETSQYLDAVPVPTLNVAGWWDAEDFYGPMKIYRRLEAVDVAEHNFLVVGPWRHGGWAAEVAVTPDGLKSIPARGESLGEIEFGSPTSEHYRREIEAAFFRHYLKDGPPHGLAEATTFQTGSNEWESYADWPPAGARQRNLYMAPDGRLSWARPSDAGAGPLHDEYVSDPAKPVPYMPRPMPGFWQGGQALWKVTDQRFVHLRPDVLAWESGALEEDVIVSGPIVAKLFASTTGTDADWVVKLIDVYPEDYPADPDMGGFQLMVADEVLRARFRNSFSEPEPVPANEVVEYTIDLNSRNHVFQRGHRIMVQVQSTWFPLIDRNPQTFVPSIFQAREEDFVKATQRVHRSARHPSHIVLTVGDR